MKGLLGRMPRSLLAAAVIAYGGMFVLYLKNPANSVKADSRGYMKLAENLKSRHTFSSSDQAPYFPEVFRLPGYPVFLAVMGAETPRSAGLAIALQCAMGVALVVLAWNFLNARCGPRGAWTGTIFLCFDLQALLHQDLIMTEALFMLLLAVGVGFSLRYIERPIRRYAAGAGLFLGIAALVKPIAIFPACFLLLCSFKDWKSALWLALAAFILPAGWVVRNWVETGYPIYTVHGNIALLQYPAAGAIAMDTGRSRSDVLEELEKDLRSERPQDAANPILLSVAYKRRAVEIMKQHPRKTIEYCLLGAVRILGGAGLEMIPDQMAPATPASSPAPQGTDLRLTGQGTLALLKNHRALIPVQLAYILFLLGGYALFGKGLYHLARRGEWRLTGFLGFCVLSILVISTSPGGYYRLRLPLLPFLAFGIAASFTERTQLR